jgi:DNA-binding SARP family transcriptional activator
VEFRILGPLEVIFDGKALDLGGPKQRAVLALLLLDANRVVSTDRLIEALWDETPPETAHKALQVYVSKLRKLLGRERLETKAPGYRLRVAPDELDLTRFQLLQQEGKPREALSLWRGPPLAELAYERFAQPEIERLAELRLSCLEERNERDLARGRHAEVIGELEALVREHPLRERLYGQLMLALYRAGRQAEALEAYRAIRGALVEQLGIDPRRELRDLHQAILRQDPSLDVVSGADGAAEAEEKRGAFVGREEELGELLRGLGDAFAGHGRVFLLEGEPGIGKSRLADELVRVARSRGATVLVGRSWEAGGAPAFWPWVQALRSYVRAADVEALRAELGTGAGELAQILPDLRELFTDLPQPVALESEGARFRLFDAVAEFLRNASKRRPIVLFLDDLHAADAPSLLLLQFLARVLASTGMVVVGAYRDVDPIPGQQLTALLAEVAREPVTRRLSLRGLSERDVAAYVESTASELASPTLVAAVHGETEGNPLFIGEIVRLLSVEGVPSESSGTVPLSIPQTVRDVIARRLSHLSEECNHALRLASVLGREFALAALARMAGISEDDLLDALDEAAGARVVSDVPGDAGRLRFAHVLIRDALYDRIPAPRRVRLHLQVVDALEGLCGEDPGPYLAELAHHSIAGNDVANGLLYARRAGDRALSLLAYEEAARLYRMALQALELYSASDETMRCHLLLSLGEAELRAGDGEAAKELFFEAAEIARRLALPRELARAAVGYGGQMVFGRAGSDARLVPLLEEGLAALGVDDVELRARLLARLAGALRDEHSRGRRDALSKEAVELARGTGNATALAYALNGRAAAIIAPDTVAEVLALGTELRAVGERAGDAEVIVQGLSHLIIAKLVGGDVSGADEDLALARAISEERGQPAHLWQVGEWRAVFALAGGRLSEGEELASEVLAVGERMHAGISTPVYLLQQYTLADFRGHLEEVESQIRELVVQYPARPVFRCAVAYLEARLKRFSAARRTLEELARDDVSALPFDQEWLFAMSFLGETSALVADTESAPVLYRLLAPWAALNAVDVAEGIRGAVPRYLGLLATTMERWSDAERHFEDALAANERMGFRPWLARTHDDYARMLLARDRSGDRGRAGKLLEAAIETYRELGMDGYLGSASVLVQKLGGRRAGLPDD